jgi:hypothetical protein
MNKQSQYEQQQQAMSKVAVVEATTGKPVPKSNDEGRTIKDTYSAGLKPDLVSTRSVNR